MYKVFSRVIEAKKADDKRTIFDTPEYIKKHEDFVKSYEKAYSEIRDINSKIRKINYGNNYKIFNEIGFQKGYIELQKYINEKAKIWKNFLKDFKKFHDYVYSIKIIDDTEQIDIQKPLEELQYTFITLKDVVFPESI